MGDIERIFAYHNYGAARNERSGGEPSVRAGTRSLFEMSLISCCKCCAAVRVVAHEHVVIAFSGREMRAW